MQTSDDAFALLIVAAEHARSLWETLADVNVPTLLICGSEEVDAVSLRVKQSAAPLDGTSVRFDGYGHLQLFWHADVTGAVIAKWARRARLVAIASLVPRETRAVSRRRL